MQSLPAKGLSDEVVDLCAPVAASSPSSSSSVPLNTASQPQRPVGSIGLMGLGGVSSALGPGPMGPLGGVNGSPRGTPMGIATPVSFAMGGAQPPVNLSLGARTSATTAVLTAPAATTSQPSIPAPIPPALRETIKKVAQFCATNGASTISMLKKKEGALKLMPFLFEGQIGFDEFLLTLKGILGMANATGSSSGASGSSIPPPSAPPPARK